MIMFLKWLKQISFTPVIGLIMAIYPLSSSAESSVTQVTIPESNTTLRYQAPIRLSNVITDATATLTYDPYILSSSLIDKSKQNKIKALEEKIFTQLDQAQTFSTEKIASQLKQSSFAQKENITLDNDVVRVFPKKNPLLKGDFELYLQKRPKDIVVYGAIQSNSAIRLPINNGYPLKDYLTDIPFYNVAMNTAIFIIQPDQTVYQMKKNHWGEQPIYLAPGAIIYIGSNEIPETLNQDIVQLLKNRLEK